MQDEQPKHPRPENPDTHTYTPHPTPDVHALQRRSHRFAEDRLIAHNPAVHDDTPPPYDVIGDIHGCIDELRDLLDRLGWERAGQGEAIVHPEGRTLVFAGDLNDRGPGSMEVWKLAVDSIALGTARYVPGNHDTKLARYLMGRDVQLTHGLAGTVQELFDLPERERRKLARRIVDVVADSPPYRILDDGKLVVAHAGIEEWMIGKMNREISVFARFGEATGERTPEGFPIRRDWAADYRGSALVVYGHTPVLVPVFRNNTVNIDQGCAFGGALTALRYPERRLVSVMAARAYALPSMKNRQHNPHLTVAPAGTGDA
jgi:protein phosphatase